MTELLLVRHGHTAFVGSALAGRLPDVHLTDLGRLEAHRAARSLSGPIAAVYSSPLERAVETAAPIAARFNRPVRPRPGLLEIDFGDWTGLRFDDLARRLDWRRFNAKRSTAAIPHGESTAALEHRVSRELQRLREAHPHERVVVVSHADVIKAAVLLRCGRSLDEIPSLEVPTGSVTEITLPERGLSIVRAWART